MAPKTQRFAAGELVKSNVPTARPVDDIMGFCAVMDARSYTKGTLA